MHIAHEQASQDALMIGVLAAMMITFLIVSLITARISRR